MNMFSKKAGRQWFIRSALISSLPDDIINQTVLEFADTPVGCSTSSFPAIVALDNANFVLFLQHGSLSSQVGQSGTLKTPAFPSPNVRPLSRLLLSTSGRWTLTITAASSLLKK